jgi:hypothetical protein
LSELETKVDAYERALCWGDYQVVPSLMKMQGTDRQNTDLKKLENIKVTSCQLLDMQISEDKLRVHQAVKINYFNTDSLIVKSLIDKRLWEYDEKQKTWYLQSDLPDFK